MKYYKDEIKIKGANVTVLETGEVIDILEGEKKVLENGTTAYLGNHWTLFFNSGGADPVLSLRPRKDVSVDIQALL